VQQHRNETCPAGLVRRAEALPGVAVEVFVEQDVVAEARIVLQQRYVAEHRPAAVRPAQEQPG